MKITLMVVGRTTSANLRAGIEEYAKRINRYIPFDIVELPDVKTTKKLTEEKQKETEGEMMLSRIQPTDYIVLLDERGKEMTSREFSLTLERKAQTVAKQLYFIVGGPYGFSPAVYARANEKMSLSKMTFPHEMVRLFFTEQLYRAYTIQRNEPYHHD
jgi:23S rRNA (pseudouridine1915-N3)-methyltransferase